MGRVGVNVKNVMTNVIISERNDVNITMVKNVFTKEKTERYVMTLGESLLFKESLANAIQLG